ncbi:hypothetical protein ABIC56_002957 [Acinetobacter bereziniae]|uniref:hypothetical protein n=1 Tax=Acinetobacter bereziniae TaxID=106648 RepID=UPI002859FAED|nr:hypothetical protein [Acinetobacter bereziniae]MDR6542982.1 hypothetical protein [Acinetobacter bereziniae]
MSREKQDEWKRTQLRIPHDQYEAVMVYAEKNNLSLNSAMLELMERGLKPIKHLDLIEENMGISDSVIDSIADKVVERLNKKP